MASDLRISVIQSMNDYKNYLMPDNRGWKVMEVGIAGDERPGGNFKLFGTGNNYKTLDVVAKYKPDIVADICNTGLDSKEWDLIILSQTLEHIFDYRSAISECFRLLKPNGVLIIDCPFMYPYHPELPEFDDYWRISPTALEKLLNLAAFDVEKSQLISGILTSVLARKPKYV